MKWTVENVPELKGYAVEWAEPNNFYLSRRNHLFHSESLKPPFKKVAAIDAPFIKNFAANFRLAQRILRFMVTNVIPLSNGDLFVTFDKSVGIVRDGKYQTLKIWKDRAAFCVRLARLIKTAISFSANTSPTPNAAR